MDRYKNVPRLSNNNVPCEVLPTPVTKVMTFRGSRDVGVVGCQRQPERPGTYSFESRYSSILNYLPLLNK
jgi:hypothetical protein